MSFLQFKNFYKQDVIKEDYPVSGDFDTWGSTLRTGVVQRSTTNDVYFFKVLSDSLGITVQEAVDLVAQRLFNKLFPNNAPNPANTEEEYRDAIFNALSNIIDEINREQGTNIKNAKSLKIYTARIVSTLGQATKTFDNAGPRAVRAAIQRVNRDIPQEVTPEPPSRDIDKLKARLLVTGFGSELNVSPDIIKHVYKIKDPTNPSVQDRLFLLKDAQNKAQQFDFASSIKPNSTVNKVNDFYSGVLVKTSIKPTTPQGVLESYSYRLKDSLQLNLNYEIPRFKFTYKEAVDYKLFSLAGRKFIKQLEDMFEVTPQILYKNVAFTPVPHLHPKPFIFNCITLLTRLGAYILYTEFQNIEKPTSVVERDLIGLRNREGISGFNRNLTGWRRQRQISNFFL